ncbi:lysylphosphatidylglycerol synthase domain-containing protein [Sphingomonas sp. GlSt437]|uniref:lysylphosphatidylglycerol synthase domain-containing protein n=1 Tax=Sphingomonas sp. GlSt437 TaxID=3389970 RepID=UPI003A8579F3
MLKYLALLLTAIGLAVALWFIGRTGFAEVAQGVASIGVAGFAVMIGFTAACLVILGGAWLAVAPGVPRQKLASFAWARAAREGATDVLPFSQFGGLVIGARAAISGGIRDSLVYASLIADQTTELAAQLAFTLFGVAMLSVALASGGHGPSMLPMVLGGTAVLAAIMAGFAFAQRPVLKMAQGLAGRLLPGSIATMAALRDELDAIYARPARVIIAFLLHLIAWVLSAFGAWVALAIMGHRLPVTSVLTIESLIFTLRTVAFAIPGGVGVQEAAYALLGPLFGLSPAAGLALSLVKRARDIAVGVPVVVAWQVSEARGLGRPA